MQPLRLIEPVPVEDDLCTALAAVENVGGWGGRLVFYAEQPCYESNTMVWVVKRKIVVPLAGLRLGNPIVRNFIDGAPSGVRVVR